MEYTATFEDEGRSLGEILRTRMQLTTRQIRSIKFSQTGLLVNQKKNWIDEGGRVRYVTTGMPIKAGDSVTACFQDEGPVVEKTPGDVEILYEDADLMVINKPSGLVCHPANGHFTDTLINRLADRYEEPARLIGRLDKETSGAILSARNAIAANRLKEQRENRTLKREYLALVEGKLSGEGVCEFPLVRIKSTIKRGKNDQPLSLMIPVHMVDETIGIREETEEELSAFTMWKALKSGSFQSQEVTLVHLQLKTGRTHQIRTHMAALGHPLLGDDLYGSGPKTKIPRTMLHSACLSFIHPFTQEQYRVEAPLPEDFEEIIRSTTWH